MKKHLHLSVLAFIFLCNLGLAQNIDTSGLWKMLPDSSRAVSPAVDTVTRQTKNDTLHAAPAAAVPDSASKQPAVSNLKLIKRSYNSRQQILLASGMMIFVITMMTMAQQFNPD
jgi:hypothetical protein